jgi:hypothetical protein
MSTEVVVLEQVTLTSPFGVRFWDVAAVTPAGAGLLVVAYPDALPGLRRTATEGPGGVHSFSGLPGLREVENGAGDDAFWSTNPPTVSYTVEVRDPEERYLPFRLSARLPVRGLFGWWASPLLTALTPDPTWVPVFSTPSRSMSGPGALVRAQLQDDLAGRPASGAVLTVRAPRLPPVTGLADDRGMLSLLQPYPEPVDNRSASPVSSHRLTDQSWPVEIGVFYTRRESGQRLPDLHHIVQQGAAFVWRDTAHTTPANHFHLEFGRDLILRSIDSASGRELSVLLVTPAGSPL